MNILDFINKIEKYDSIAIEYDNMKKNYKDFVDDIYEKASIVYSNDMKGKNIFISNKLTYEWIVEYIGAMLAGARVVIAEEYLKEKIRGEMKVYDINDLKANDKNQRVDFSNIQYDISTIIYTSGTNGLPKPVLLSCENIFSDVVHCTNVIDRDLLNIGDKTIPILPNFHMFGITATVLAPLYIGLDLCLINEIKNLDQAMSKHEPALMFFVPMIAKGILKKINYISKTKKADKKIITKGIFGNNLKMIICGGASLGTDIIENYKNIGINLLNGYGITECSPVVSCAKASAPLGSVGKVNMDEYCKVKIEDGIIKVKGSIVMAGYGDVNIDSQIDSEGWFNTMDTGYIDEENNLFITGRKSNLIVLDDGNNISPEELELLIESVEEVKEAMVYDEKLPNNQIIAAEIVLEDLYRNKEFNEIKSIIDEKINVLNSSLPNYKKIRKFNLRTEDFKKNRLGKVIRKEVMHGKIN